MDKKEIEIWLKDRTDYHSTFIYNKYGKKDATSLEWHMNCHNSFYNKTTNYV